MANRKINITPNRFRYGEKMAASGAGSRGRLVQYVVVRSDLVHKLSWPLGAVITQACHAATAAIHLNYGDADTQLYLAELDSMHKVVLGVSAPDSSHTHTHTHTQLHVFYRTRLGPAHVVNKTVWTE